MSDTDDPVIAALTDQAAHARDQWRAKLLSYSRKAEGPLGPGESEVDAGGPYHPILPGVVALCIASGDAGDGDRFSEANVLKKTGRYVGMLDGVLASTRQRRSTATLTALFNTDEAPSSVAAAWALDPPAANTVEPFASDAILAEVKRELLETVSRREGAQAVSRALFEYQVLVSYWELLIEARERRAATEARRNDWWVQPTSKVAAFFSLVGTLPSPALVPAGGIALAIGVAQLVFLMGDTIAQFESAAKREAFEAVLASDDERLARALAPNPIVWKLLGALARDVGLQAALNYVVPVLGLAYDVYQDMAGLVSEE
jgi:hypothetical protein